MNHLIPENIKDIVLWCSFVGLVSLCIGIKIGYEISKRTMELFANELYKQLDIDNKPFIPENEDFDDDTFGYYEGDSWKNK